MKFGNIKTIKEYILEKVSEEAIFSYYLDIPITSIYDSITNKSKVKNKHRFEQDASIQFFCNNKVKMVDYGNRRWSGDCFHVAGIVLRKDCNNPKDFIFILNDIIENVVNSNVKYIGLNCPVTSKQRSFTKIDILNKNFCNNDYLYFNRYHIRKESLINVFCIDNYWINNELNTYKYKKDDPCYAYYLGKTEGLLWKLYFPFRKKGQLRFITNNTLSIENINELKGNKNLILIKSQKDKLLLKQIIKDLSITDIDVSSTLSESIRLEDNLVQYINSKYENKFTLFDNDSSGIEASDFFEANYRMHSIFLEGSREYLSKDISDTSKDYGYDYVLNLIRNFYLNIK